MNCKYKIDRSVFGIAWMLAIVLGCNSNSSTPTGTRDKQPTIGVAFETLQTEFWVAGLDAIKAACQKNGYQVAESIADGDSNRQLQQIKNFITRRVDGIVLVPKDSKSCGPMIRAANNAKIPIVIFNRTSDASELEFVSVVADNQLLSQQTTERLLEQAKSLNRKIKAMILLGDLSDSNAIRRRDGFDAAIKAFQGDVEVVAQVPTDWNQEKAQAGVVNAMQANPDIDLIFTSSDFMLPGIVSALRGTNKYHRIGQPGHVILGGFDGDATAYAMMRDKYLDATGVQDVFFEAQQCVEAIDRLRRGEKIPKVIDDPGFVIDQESIGEKASRMWGAHVAAKGK